MNQTEDPAAKYVPVLTHILEICQQYASVFRSKDEPLKIYSFQDAPDELDWIGVGRSCDDFELVVRNCVGRSVHDLPTVARLLSDYELCAGGNLTSPRHIWDNFITNFRQPLGRYLAKRELNGLAARLTFDNPAPQAEPKHA